MKLTLTATGLVAIATFNLTWLQDDVDLTERSEGRQAVVEQDATLDLSREVVDAQLQEDADNEKARADTAVLDATFDERAIESMSFDYWLSAQQQGAGGGFILDLSIPQHSQTATVLGVHVRRPDDTLRSQLEIEEGMGLVIEEVIGDSAAENADLRVHDVIVAFDRQLLVNEEQLTTLVRNQEPGDEVSLTIFRAGEKMQADVELQTGSISREVPLDVPLSEYHPRVDLSVHKTHAAFMKCTDCHVGAQQTEVKWDLPK